MTTCLYDSDAYLSRFTARVVSVAQDADQWDIVLDRTAFFPEQGGQTADTGTLDGRVRVLDAHIRDGVIHHLCDGPLDVGATVEGALDFSRRFSHMQQHTGEHILSGHCARMFGCRNVGFHLSDHIVTVDYDRPLDEAQLDALVNEANRSVWDDLPVRCWYPTDDEAEALHYRCKKEILSRLRIVSIPGVDDCACCAPHVRRTGEVGLISIESAARYKGGVRLSILCGRRALAAAQARQRLLAQLTRRMTCGEDELPQILDKRDAELRGLKQRAARLQAEVLALGADAARARGERCLRAETQDMQAMAQAAVRLAGDGACTAGVFAGSDDEGYSFCLAGGDLTTFFSAFRTTLNARGGGDDQLIRGKTAAGWPEIAAWFEHH